MILRRFSQLDAVLESRYKQVYDEQRRTKRRTKQVPYAKGTPASGHGYGPWHGNDVQSQWKPTRYERANDEDDRGCRQLVGGACSVECNGVWRSKCQEEI